MPGTLPGAREAAVETLKDLKGAVLSLKGVAGQETPWVPAASWSLERPEGSIAGVLRS